MAIGVMISGIVSGLFAVIWTLIVGAPVLVVLFAYPVGGMAGVALFLIAASGITRHIPSPPALVHVSADSRRNQA